MKILAQSTCTASDQHKNQDPLCIFGPSLLCQRSGVLCTLTSQTQPPLVSTLTHTCCVYSTEMYFIFILSTIKLKQSGTQ